jgi:hypothetical protein
MMWGINRGREGEIDVLRELRREKCCRIREEYVGLVLIRREVLSTVKSVRFNK